MKRQYLRTSHITRAVGVHPNTVRLYGAWSFLPPVPRAPNGYRMFTDAHLDQMRLARLAGCCIWLGGDIREAALSLIKQAALDRPGPDEDAHYATDRRLSTLAEIEQATTAIIAQLQEMIAKRQDQVT